MEGVIWELLVLLILGAVLFWAIPKLGFPEIVRTIFVVVFVFLIVLLFVRGPLLF